MKPWARKQIKAANGRKKKTNNRSASKDADVERLAGDEPLAACKSAFFNSRVSVRITHYRSRFADPGGPSSKALIDGLVRAGVLRDDSLLWIAEPIIEVQVKVKNQDEEKTVVEIEEVDKEER